MLLILVINLSSCTSAGLELVATAFTITWESPKTFSSWIPSSLGKFTPCKRANASACMLDVWHRSQAKLCGDMMSGILMCPPALAFPGFPFVTPSKNREGIGWMDSKSWKSYSFFLICQSSRVGGELLGLWNLNLRTSPRSQSCLLRFESYPMSSSHCLVGISLCWLLLCGHNLCSEISSYSFPTIPTNWWILVVHSKLS